MSAWPGVIETYRDWLDLPPDLEPITLLEGNTPLIPAPSLATELFAASVHIKFEGLNPTGSFKDRGMTTAISLASHRGSQVVICASTGNTASSAAAYAGRAGMRCAVLIPEGKVASGKLAGAVVHGAQVLQISGSFDRALELVRSISEDGAAALVNSVNPDRLMGQQTLAFELHDQLGRLPDWLALPVGNAGNISAIWMGLTRLQGNRLLKLPRLLGVQAAGAAPLVYGRPIEAPETIATAIRIGRPARGDQALNAARESGGGIVAASDEAIIRAQRDLAHLGIWVEPASAAGLAGLRHEVQAGRIQLEGLSVVILCTGHGLKDPDIISARMGTPLVIEASTRALQEAIGS
jgi:threonine synthase